MIDGAVMKLTKMIPAHRKTLVANWCNREFVQCQEVYRKIRSEPNPKCYWCKRKFKDGEMMALAQFKKKGNKVLCQDCAVELIKSEEK